MGFSSLIARIRNTGQNWLLHATNRWSQLWPFIHQLSDRWSQSPLVQSLGRAIIQRWFPKYETSSSEPATQTLSSTESLQPQPTPEHRDWLSFPGRFWKESVSKLRGAQWILAAGSMARWIWKGCTSSRMRQAMELSTEPLTSPRDSVNPAASYPWLTSRSMEQRMLIASLGALVVSVVLAGRLIQLQVLEQDDFSRTASGQRIFRQTVPARPGDILDSSGRILATTVTTQSFYLVPSLIDEPESFASKVASVLQFDPQKLSQKIRNSSKSQFLWIKRRLDPSEVLSIRELKLPRDQWGFREEYRRVYPQGLIAAHVLGLRNIDGIGQGGIEESQESILAGQPGSATLLRDARGRVLEIEPTSTMPMSPGESVTLTIDTVIQLQTERVLDEVMTQWQPSSVCAISMDPHTGEILSMASRPTFDPNQPELAGSDSWKNRAISDIYEPGSTFKPLIVAYGLEAGLIQKDQVFDCERGQYRMGRRVLHDTHAYGSLNLTDVLVKSSNIGMAKVGELLGNAELFEAAQRFGIGRRTGIELTGELPGLLRPLSQWNSYSTGSIPMGHELAATPLQMIAAHAAIANGGVWRSPTIIKAPRESRTQVSQQVISSDVSRWMISEPLREVVTRGTGKKAQLDDYEVFGKTGTAQVLLASGGYSHGKYVSSFICGAPIDKPRAIVLVVVNEASVGGEAFGGKVAAPAAAEILKHTLRHLSKDLRWAASPAKNHPSR